VSSGKDSPNLHEWDWLWKQRNRELIKIQVKILQSGVWN